MLQTRKMKSTWGLFSFFKLLSYEISPAVIGWFKGQSMIDMYNTSRVADQTWIKG